MQSIRECLVRMQRRVMRFVGGLLVARPFRESDAHIGFHGLRRKKSGLRR
jgi:hypothetical protein